MNGAPRGALRRAGETRESGADSYPVSMLLKNFGEATQVIFHDA